MRLEDNLLKKEEMKREEKRESGNKMNRERVKYLVEEKSG